MKFLDVTNYCKKKERKYIFKNNHYEKSSIRNILINFDSRFRDIGDMCNYFDVILLYDWFVIIYTYTAVVCNIALILTADV